MIKKHGGKAIRCIGMVLCALLLCFNSGEQMNYVRNIYGVISHDELAELGKKLRGPMSVSLGDGSVYVGSDLSESLKGKKGTASVRLMGLPIKKIAYGERPEVRVMPGGMSIGVSIYTDGALVVGLGSVSSEADICPAADAGIRPGDIITAVNGEEVKDTGHLEELCEKGGELKVTLRRKKSVEECVICPLYDESSHTYRAGMWVRDSTSGIGTMSFCSSETGRYGALGHPITDVDTGSVIAVKSGAVVESSIIGVSAGANGVPGEVIGSFSRDGCKIGTVDLNCACGIYGDVINMPLNPLYPNGIAIARSDELQEGPAQLMCVLDDNGIKAYSCDIIKLYHNNDMKGKNMVIRITDSELIEKTGGIIQGMSGSPIIQNGRLAGAVTHVLVNDPTKGYGIFIEDMLEAAA